MKKILKEGIRITTEKTVEPQDLATHFETGKIAVLATPAMIAFMIQTTVKLIENYLPENKDTVGIEMNVKHIKPVLSGEKIKCIAHLKYIENNQLFFDVAVLNEELEEVGLGAHERVVVDSNLFQ